MNENKDRKLIYEITNVMSDALMGHPASNDVFNQIDLLLKKYYNTNSGDVKMDELIKSVEIWSKDKGIDQAEPSKQFLKVTEEVGEVAAALARSKEDDLKDAIGDTVVTLIILSIQSGLSLEECLQTAYDEIKDRQGITVNGVFVKQSDLEG